MVRARREQLGRIVRDTWVAWASEQPNPKPSWLVPWEQLDEGQREVDMRIGETIADTVEAAMVLAQRPGKLTEIRQGMENFLAEYGASELPMFRVAQDLANSVLKILDRDQP